MIHLKVQHVLKAGQPKPNVARRRIGYPRRLSAACLHFLQVKTGLPDKMLAFFDFLNGVFSKISNSYQKIKLTLLKQNFMENSKKIITAHNFLTKKSTLSSTEC